MCLIWASGDCVRALLDNISAT